MKRYIFGIFIVLITLASFVFYNHQQPPTIDDIDDITKNWSPPITEVYTIQKLNEEWITFFRSDQMLFVTNLKKNWLGQWDIYHKVTDDKMPLGSAVLDLSRDKDVVLGVSGVSKENNDMESYYYGMIMNPKIQSILIEVDGETFDTVPLIKTKRERFFLYKKKGDLVPFTFKAFNENGEVIYEKK